MKLTDLLLSHRKGHSNIQRTVHCMKLCFILLAIVLGSFPTSVVRAEEPWPAGPEVKAASAIVMEADTGAILYEKDIHAQNYPASITKIMTTLLALENASLQDVVTFSFDSINKTEGSRVGFINGEELTMEQCLYSVMLASANEAAYAVAEHVGKTLDNFIVMMNEKAVSLGCTETHFANPHGLPDETHVTSAHDMALIAQEAYKNETFRTIAKTLSYTVPATNKAAEPRPLSNHHKMLKKGQFNYPYCTGGKTGYTNAARNTLVTYAERNGMTLICVIMRDDVSADQYLDTAALLDYGFNNFHKLTITENDLGLHLDSNGFFPIEHNHLDADAGKIALSPKAKLVVPNIASVTDITSSVGLTEKTSGEIASVSCYLGEHFLGKSAILYTPGKNAGKINKTKAATTVQTEEKKPFPVKKALLGAFIALCLIGFIVVVLYCIRYGVFELEGIRDHETHLSQERKKGKKHVKPSKPSKSQTPKQTVSKTIGSAKTPRLRSDFEPFDLGQEQDDPHS